MGVLDVELVWIGLYWSKLSCVASMDGVQLRLCTSWLFQSFFILIIWKDDPSVKYDLSVYVWARCELPKFWPFFRICGNGTSGGPVLEQLGNLSSTVNAWCWWYRIGWICCLRPEDGDIDLQNTTPLKCKVFSLEIKSFGKPWVDEQEDFNFFILKESKRTSLIRTATSCYSWYVQRV